MTRFVVDLGHAAISKEKQAAIAASIQSTVIQHLADTDMPQQLQVGYIPIWWRGYILRPDFEELAVAEKQIAPFAAGGLRTE